MLYKKITLSSCGACDVPISLIMRESNVLGVYSHLKPLGYDFFSLQGNS